MNFNNKKVFNSLPDAILFDLDNTLYDYQPAHKAAWYQVIKKVTSLFMIEGSQFSKAFYEARSQIKDQLGNTASSHSRLLYFQRTLELLGLGAHVISALDLEQTKAREMVLEVKDKKSGLVKLVGNPVKISQFKNGTKRKQAPELDGDRKKILKFIDT